MKRGAHAADAMNIADRVIQGFPSAAVPDDSLEGQFTIVYTHNALFLRASHLVLSIHSKCWNSGPSVLQFKS